MKYFSAFFAVLIISLVVVQNLAAKDSPKLVCDKPTYNFGEMVNIKTVKHTFILRNEGDAPLVISNVRASCGCTTANISNKTIAPGEEVTLDAQLALQGYKGDVKKNITVMSNDPERPQLILYLEGTAIEDIKIEPNNVSFGYIAEKATATKTVDITAAKNSPLQITKIEADSNYYDTKLETIEDKKAYQLKITLKPQSSAKKISDKIYVFTDNSAYEKIEIIVSANIFRLLRTTPDAIIFPANIDKPVTKYIVIYSIENKPFQIKSVTAPISSIQTEVFPMANGYSIQISNIESTKELDGKNLQITTDLEGEKEILIPFRITPP